MSVVLSENLPLLAAAPNGIQKVRGLILELAVRGKLLPQDSNDEPASELLKRIAHERAQQDSSKARKKIDQPLLGRNAPLFELPETWTWVPFGEIALHNAGKTLDKGRNTGHPHLGFIVIDSPLKSYADPKNQENKDVAAGTVTSRYYDWLSKRSGRGQIVILENEEISELAKALLKPLEFIGEGSGEGRKGFYPN